MHSMNNKIEDSEILYYSSVQATDVHWLWYPYIPYGKITILQGDPGDGKSTLMIDLIAKLTTGSALPDGSVCADDINCVYQCSEDTLSDTIKPRLVKAGADCEKVAYICDEEETLTLDDSRIEKSVSETHAKLLVLDPLQSFLSQNGDLQNAIRIRILMKKLKIIAEKHGCAVVLICHLNKAENKKNLYRILGSIDITASARSVLMTQRDNEDRNLRYLTHIKSNLAPEGDSFAYRLGSQKSVEWIAKCPAAFTDQDGNLIMKQSKTELAEKLLKVLLGNGEQPTSVILEKMNDFDLSERTVREAKKSLNIKAKRKNGIWYWASSDSEEKKNG